MSTTYRFDGKVAIVTGGGSGIGEACALLLASGGAKVAVVDYNAEGGERVARHIHAQGGDATFLQADVSLPHDVQRMVAHTVETFGPLNIAVNNAGIGGPRAATGEYAVEDWQRVIDTNLSGVFYCMRAEIPWMLEANPIDGGGQGGSGSIVNMASILGSVGFANSPAYVAAKHGVVGLTKTAALEYASRGIRINCVGPAFIQTPMLSVLDEALMAQVSALHPLGRIGQPEEVAHLVALLCSDEASSFMTGGYYLVDGGYTAR